MSAPLANTRVLDLSRILAGPWCGQILADLGADVIKVERPKRGDDTRGWGPPFLKDSTGNDTGDAAYYLSANRGKRSITVDITNPKGQALLRKLVAESDILLENYKAGGLAKYGLDYGSLHAINPRLIYCSITGFGHTGPYRHRPGYDFMIQALGGLMSITGERDDTPGAGPQKVGVAMADILTGLYASIAVLAGLAHRERTGEGQHIDLALFDVQVACLANQAMNYLVGGEVPTRMGNAHPNIVPYQAFATADGHIILAVGNDEQFVRFCGVAGLESMARDERYSSNAARVQRRDELIPLIEAAMSKRTSEAWLSTLESAGIPCGPINSIAEVFDNPQLQHRGMQITMEHAAGTEVTMPGSPLKFSASPVRYQRPPPTLGEHTEEVLLDLLQLSSRELEELRTQQVV